MLLDITHFIPPFKRKRDTFGINKVHTSFLPFTESLGRKQDNSHFSISSSQLFITFAPYLKTYTTDLGRYEL